MNGDNGIKQKVVVTKSVTTTQSGTREHNGLLYITTIV